MTEYVSVTKPGLARSLAPEAIVLMDPSNGAAMGSADNPLRVQVTNVSTADRELLVTLYRCKLAFSGASVGDTITATRVLDVTASTAAQVGLTLWRNESTSLDLAGAPGVATLELSGTVGLTDAQLRAAAVPVSGPLTDAQLRAAVLPVSLPAVSRSLTALLTSAVVVSTGAFVQTTGGGFSVVVSGSTTAGAGAATAVIEGSHDGIVPITLATITLTLGTVAVADGFGSAVPYRYVRARLSVLSGTGASVSATLGS